MSKISEILYELALSMDESYQAKGFTDRGYESKRSPYICDNLSPRVLSPYWPEASNYTDDQRSAALEFLYQLGMGTGLRVFGSHPLSQEYKGVPLRITFLIFASEIAEEWGV